MISFWNKYELRFFVTGSILSAAANAVLLANDIIGIFSIYEYATLIAFIIFFISTYLIIYKLRKEITELKKKELAIIFKEGHPFEFRGPDNIHGYRVAVETRGGVSIEGVHVELIEFDPPHNSFVPIVLHLKGNDPPQEEKYRFDIDPGEREYIDIVYKQEEKTVHSFWLCYADRSKPNQMPAQIYPYKITLAAYGKDVVESCTEQFVFGVDNDGRLWFQKAKEYEKNPESRILP